MDSGQDVGSSPLIDPHPGEVCVHMGDAFVVVRADVFEKTGNVAGFLAEIEEAKSLSRGSLALRPRPCNTNSRILNFWGG